MELLKTFLLAASRMYQMCVVRLKDVSNVCSTVLANIWNEEIPLNKNFSENLKLADVTPIFKKIDKTFVENYRPLSVLPTISKIFERIMQKQITDYIGKFPSPFPCGYRKGFSTLYVFVIINRKVEIMP